jgi:hypothetical protein
MHNDFYLAFLSGWFILLIFWTTIIIFVYFRKPPNSKLTRQTLIKSYSIFSIFLMFILLYGFGDSFL